MVRWLLIVIDSEMTACKLKVITEFLEISVVYRNDSFVLAFSHLLLTS